MCTLVRAVGWHLLTARDKAEMDCQGLKAHVEEVEGVLEKEKAEWDQKQGAIEGQVAEIKVCRNMQEGEGRVKVRERCPVCRTGGRGQRSRLYAGQEGEGRGAGCMQDRKERADEQVVCRTGGRGQRSRLYAGLEEEGRLGPEAGRHRGPG